MSCHILSNEDLSILAGFIAKLLDNGTSYFGFSANEELLRGLPNCFDYSFANQKKIFEVLYRMNEKAYNIRYKENQPSIADAINYRALDITKPVGFESGYYILEQWHYQVYKLIQSYIYQCSEDISIEKSPLYVGLEILKDTLAKFLVCNTKEYKEAKWA